MLKDGKILVGKNKETEAYILLNKANRHGLITGATGTGKTVTLKVLAESFSSAGVPVFMVDVKGDLAGTAYIGEENENVDSRVKELELDDFKYDKYPCVFLDTYGKKGQAVRTTLTGMGHRLLSKMLDLSEVQDSVLAMVFKIAKDEERPLDDLNDLRDMLTYVSNNREKYSAEYGNLAAQSLSTIQRSVIEMIDDIGDNFFGKPVFDYHDLFNTSLETGKGRISILDAQELFNSPDSYVAMTLWLLNDLFDQLPEVGDQEKPKLVFFFDEAHLIFNNMPKSVIDHVIKVVKLIRSKGVGVYFISQSPSDIPEEVLAQLGNKVQHALRAYTPNEQKAIKAAADGLRSNPKFDTKEAIQNLGTGEALVSFIDEKGEPSVVEKVTILPPQSRMGAITDDERQFVIDNSPVKVGPKVNEVSASEMLAEETAKANAEKEAEAQRKADEKAAAEQAKIDEKERKEQEKREKEEQRAAEKAAKEEERKQKEEIRAQEKAEKEAEKAKKNSIGYKLGKKVVNKAENKIIDKTLNKLFKGFFK